MSQIKNKFLAQMPTLTIKGNNTGGTANPLDLTVAQVNAILPAFTSSLNGLAPSSGGGTTNFLRADGTWAAPPGATSGTVTSVAMTVPSFLSISGSPITTSGTLAVTLSGTALPVANGGTGDTSFTAYAPIAGGTTTTGALQSLSSGMSTAGFVLTSNGTSAAPTWQAGGGASTATAIGASYYVHASSYGASAGAAINFDTQWWDNNGSSGTCVTTGTSWVFTAPKTGKYSISVSTCTSNTVHVNVYVNGSLFKVLGTSPSSNTQNTFSSTIVLTATNTMFFGTTAGQTWNSSTTPTGDNQITECSIVFLGS